MRVQFSEGRLMTEADHHTEMYRRITFAESHAKEAKLSLRDARRLSMTALIVAVTAVVVAVVALLHG